MYHPQISHFDRDYSAGTLVESELAGGWVSEEFDEEEPDALQLEHED